MLHCSAVRSRFTAPSSRLGAFSKSVSVWTAVIAIPRFPSPTAGLLVLLQEALEGRVVHRLEGEAVEGIAHVHGRLRFKPRRKGGRVHIRPGDRAFWVATAGEKRGRGLPS